MATRNLATLRRWARWRLLVKDRRLLSNDSRVGLLPVAAEHNLVHRSPAPLNTRLVPPGVRRKMLCDGHEDAKIASQVLDGILVPQLSYELADGHWTVRAEIRDPPRLVWKRFRDVVGCVLIAVLQVLTPRDRPFRNYCGAECP